jgi:hypothetical protein
MKTTFLLALLAVGCDSSQAQINITKTVGSEGGDVTAGDGTSLNVPMGALGMSTAITISPVTVAAPPGTVLVGPAYDFQPEGTQFQTAVTITLPFDGAKIPTGLTKNDISIYTAPKGTTNYSKVFTQLGTSGDTVTTQTTHLSVYLPATPAAACTPVCTTTPEPSPSCSCTASCNGNMQEIQCFGSTTLSCFCELNHQTMSAPPVSSCDNIMQAFNTCFAG